MGKNNNNNNKNNNNNNKTNPNPNPNTNTNTNPTSSSSSSSLSSQSQSQTMEPENQINPPVKSVADENGSNGNSNSVGRVLLSKVTKGSKLAEGKTKIVWGVNEDASMAIIENKRFITAHDDPNFTRSFASKGVSATTTTCNVFDFLKSAGIPVSYYKRLSDLEFLACNSKMIPLEIVTRRIATGSYLKRHPHLTPKANQFSKRFHNIVVEFFLKTEPGGVFNGVKYESDDPFLPNALTASPTEEWEVVHPKKTAGDSSGKLGVVKPSDVLPNGVTIHQLAALARRVFWVLEKGWAMQGFTLVDLKIEVDSACRVADVVDSDSWRLWRDGEDFSKQVFRDGGEKVLEEVERKYAYIADLSKHLTIPKQVLFIAAVAGLQVHAVPGVEYVTGRCPVAGSVQLLKKFENIINSYPQGGVAIVSTAIAPLFSQISPFPVIAITDSTNPSQVDMASSPFSVINSNSSNPIYAALRILSLSNPAVYCSLQEHYEVRDQFESEI